MIVKCLIGLVKLLSCGKNKFGQLFLDDLYPVETKIKSGFSFFITGANTSFVFINGLPPNWPDKKVNLKLLNKQK